METNSSTVLVSPSEKRPDLPEGNVLVDCHTFYLYRKGVLTYTERRLRALDHYNWYIQKVEQHATDLRLTFVVPDCDWLGPEGAAAITDLWVSRVNGVPCLAMPSEESYPRIKGIVGHCLRPHHGGPAHPEWTHTFSVPRVALDGVTKRWTYDSISEATPECLALIQQKDGLTN